MDLKDQLVEVCHLLYQRKLVSSTGGNVSVRTERGLYITPTGYSLGELTRDDIVEMDLEGNVLSGGRPSKEWRFHTSLLKLREDVNAVIHAHPTYAVAVSCRKDLELADAMPALTPGYLVRVGKLPAVPYAPPGTEDLARSVEDVLRDHHAVLMQNHGVTVVAKDLRYALILLEEIEENAHLYLLLGRDYRSLS
ncbi:MAG: class II aldolase/adducin family protein [Thermoanaerobacteraceae bacterium]|uniref:class II aldolase/adducin family protein n=1 Tax=Thermanaeromonas sp. C210 TaxID=2731925 RepID=UPI00155BD999|nr:class II aldolase/adducin family protein [Thermanaeromonas sp. C210]MBE3581070.1 class II aldolase/adducin family protein [Thermoanaerobacteraceae bacterium]GFN22668.1 fuculose phosphate aldolase [Thermanaeromonas sp. C210]